MYFQDLIQKLSQFWAKRGCLIAQPYDQEVGAGTFHPLTFFRTLDERPWRTAFVQPTRRPTDGRYGENPLRLQHYYQFQVIIKPRPEKIKEIYLSSLRALGIRKGEHDLRFVEDDWESPTLGAAGLGWEVWLDSLEITQFTYFQQMAGLELEKISVELTYGLERICMFLQNVYDVFNLQWSKGRRYGDIHLKEEEANSKYNFEQSDVEMLRTFFELYKKEADRLLNQEAYIPAYDYVLKMSHTFNLLDAHKAVSTAQRQSLILEIRKRAASCARLYLKSGQDLYHRSTEIPQRHREGAM